MANNTLCYILASALSMSPLYGQDAQKAYQSAPTEEITTNNVNEIMDQYRANYQKNRWLLSKCASSQTTSIKRDKRAELETLLNIFKEQLAPVVEKFDRFQEENQKRAK